MANLPRNAAFAFALDYLYNEGIVADQQELSAKTGISESTISRILNDKVKKPSEETTRRLNSTFDGIFNLSYFRGESPYLLMKDAADAKQKADDLPIDKPTANIIELYASLIQDIEKIRQQVKQELAEVQSLKHEYITARDDFRKAITLLHPALKYETPNEQPRMAAEPETPQK